MTILIVAIMVLAVLYGPQWWARHVLLKYNREEYFSGTGLDFAHLLVKDLKLTGVRVSDSQLPSHYDPEEKVVAIEPRFANSRSLSAIVIAAHEVGHAMQDHERYPALSARSQLVRLGASVERLGSLVFIVMPILAFILRAPLMGPLMLFAAAIILIMPLCIHLITLPVELDASFRRALPLLSSKPYIPEEDLPAARTILTACALTYVAAALAGFFNVWRWLRMLKR